MQEIERKKQKRRHTLLIPGSFSEWTGIDGFPHSSYTHVPSLRAHHLLIVDWSGQLASPTHLAWPWLGLAAMLCTNGTPRDKDPRCTYTYVRAFYICRIIGLPCGNENPSRAWEGGTDKEGSTCPVHIHWGTQETTTQRFEVYRLRRRGYAWNALSAWRMQRYLL